MKTHLSIAPERAESMSVDTQTKVLLFEVMKNGTNALYVGYNRRELCRILGVQEVDVRTLERGEVDNRTISHIVRAEQDMVDFEATYALVPGYSQQLRKAA